MKATPEHNGTILLLALTSWDKKLEIHIPCPDAKAWVNILTQVNHICTCSGLHVEITNLTDKIYPIFGYVGAFFRYIWKTLNIRDKLFQMIY